MVTQEMQLFAFFLVRMFDKSWNGLFNLEEKHPCEFQKWVNATGYGNKSIFVSDTKEETVFTTSYGLKTCFLSNWLSRTALLPESAILKEACG